MFGKKKSNISDNTDKDIDIAEDGFSDFFDDSDSIDSIQQKSMTTKEEVVTSQKQIKEENKKSRKEKNSINNGDAIEKRKMMLFLIIDREVDGLLAYFRQSGVNVSNIFYDITEAKNEVLMQTEPLRIVIVDTGLGKFTTTTMRGELIDMLGISDEQNRTSVFYTDSVLKVDTLRSLGKSGKSIDWQKYESTAMVVATLLRYNEEYILDSESDKLDNSTEEIGLNFKGIKCSIPDVPRMDISGFSKEAIITHVLSNTDGCIQGYEIRL